MGQRYVIKLAYLGGNYQGFQRQKKSINTIEGIIINALKELGIISKVAPARYSAAGRTDKGVNAISQVISFDSLKEEIYLEEINQRLPEDIYAWAIAKVHDSFNARHDAIKRTYRLYRLYENENIELMVRSLEQLKGTNDFAKLCKKPNLLPNGYQKTTVLTLDEAHVHLDELKRTLIFEFSSRSFLWMQVRKMVSLVLAIGSGKTEIGMIDEVLNPKSKLPKGGINPIAPEGLVLYEVQYPNINFQFINKQIILEKKLLKNLHSEVSKLSVIELIKNRILQ